MVTVLERILVSQKKKQYDGPAGSPGVPYQVRLVSAGAWFWGQTLIGSNVPDEMSLEPLRELHPGRCALFDGVDDLIHIPLGSSVNYPFRMSCWINTGDQAATAVAMSLCNSSASDKFAGIKLTAAEGLSIVRTDGTEDNIATGYTFPIGSWVNVLVDFADSTSLTVFIDGADFYHTTMAAAKALVDVLDTVCIGAARVVSPQQYFAGKIFDAVVEGDNLAAPPVFHALYSDGDNRFYSDGDRAQYSDQ